MNVPDMPMSVESWPSCALGLCDIINLPVETVVNDPSVLLYPSNLKYVWLTYNCVFATFYLSILPFQLGITVPKLYSSSACTCLILFPHI